MGRPKGSKNKKSVEDRFWSKVNKTESCWLWTGSKSDFGHGQIRIDGRNTVASRYVWEIMKGPITDRLFVLHKCDNPTCVRIDHLFLGTQKDNIKDMHSKGRAFKGNYKGKLNPASKLTEEEVIRMREMHHESNLNYCELARLFKVHNTTSRAIIKRENWAHI